MYIEFESFVFFYVESFVFRVVVASSAFQIEFFMEATTLGYPICKNLGGLLANS